MCIKESYLSIRRSRPAIGLRTAYVREWYLKHAVFEYARTFFGSGSLGMKYMIDLAFLVGYFVSLEAMVAAVNFLEYRAEYSPAKC